MVVSQPESWGSITAVPIPPNHSTESGDCQLFSKLSWYPSSGLRLVGHSKKTDVLSKKKPFYEKGLNLFSKDWKVYEQRIFLTISVPQSI